MKPGFYISMGIAIGALAVGFTLLYDIQQENEEETIWIQKIPTQCNDVWAEEYNEFYEINPELKDSTDEESKLNYQTIIKTHYENQEIKILDVSLEFDVYDGVRCSACSCLGWDKLSIKIPLNHLEWIPPNEGWEPVE